MNREDDTYDDFEAKGKRLAELWILRLFGLLFLIVAFFAWVESARPQDPSLVRITSHGCSGAIIASQPGRSYILSCSHMFTDSRERPSQAMLAKPLEIDILRPNAGPQKRCRIF